MPEETFKRCIDELAALGYKGRIGLYNNNEPLMDRRIVAFISYVSEKLPEADIFLMTNGLLLTPELGKQLLDTGLKTLAINNYTDDNTLLKNVEAFLTRIAPHYPDRRITLSMRKLTQVLNNHGGWSPNKAKKRKPLKLCCRFPFDMFVITTNGDVGLCCVDFVFDPVMGNVNEQTILEIWHGEKFESARRNLLKGNRSWCELCARCDVPPSWEHAYGTFGSRFLGPLLGSFL